MATTQKQTERWEVEWTTDVPVSESGDSDPDAGTDNVEYFTTRDEAVAFARSKIEADYWGCPRVSLMRRRVWNPRDGGRPLVDWDCVETVDVA